MRKVLLKGGPADDETVEVEDWMTEVRVCKLPDCSPILADVDAPMVADVVFETYSYRKHAQNENIFLYLE